MSTLSRRTFVTAGAALPALAASALASEPMLLPTAQLAMPSAMEKAVVRLRAAKAAVAKDNADDGDTPEDVLGAMLDEQALAEWGVIQAPAMNLADVRLRAPIMRQIVIDAEELGEPGDNRHHAALAALVADIFNDDLMEGAAQ